VPKAGPRLLQNCPKPVIVSVGAGGNHSAYVVKRIEWSVPVSSELQAKLEKYERKAAQYKKSAEEATGEANRAFYQGLARYTDDLAAKFRQVIAKRNEASLPVE
jgi:hypothetical protein